VGRELLNFYRGMVQKRGETWPRFNLLLSSVHSLMDQEYSGDINIVPDFRWYNPAKLISHLSEKDLIELMEGGERSAYPAVEAIRTCTKISRTMEEILSRFEQGDLRPDESEYHRPRSSRRRPPPTRADREALREHRLLSDQVKKPTQKKLPAARRKSATRDKSATTRKAPIKTRKGPRRAA
jgi:TAG lipase / steryl ester hydrolase / phospholipase A2 / LPA acyltransferase